MPAAFEIMRSADKIDKLVCCGPPGQLQLLVADQELPTRGLRLLAVRQHLVCPIETAKESQACDKSCIR
jgi:hypothetical protein